MTTELEKIGRMAGLPVRSRPEWSFARPDGAFRFDLDLLGERIVVVRAQGRVDVDDVERSMTLSTAVVDCYVPPPQTYVTILDFRAFHGATPGAKASFVRRMTARPRMASVVFCGLSPLLRRMVSMTRRLGQLRGPVLIARTLEEAAAMAREHLGEPASPIEAAAEAPDEAVDELRAEHDPSWRIESEGFSAEFEFYGGRVLHARLRGFLRGEVIPGLTALIDRILGESRGARRMEYVVGDLSALESGSPDARRRYQEALEARSERQKIRACFIYGAKGRVRAAMGLASFVLPFPVRIVTGLPEALLAIREFEERQQKPGLTAKVRGWLGLDRRRLSAEASEILRYLGQIRWDREGLSDPDTTAPGAAPEPIVEAVQQIKWEFDELVAARQHALEETRRIALQRQALVEVLPDGVALFGSDGSLLLANPAAGRLLPELASRDERGRWIGIAGIALDELCGPGQAPEWHEHELDGPDGRILEIAGAQLDEGLRVALLRDVTHGRRLARELAGQERLAAVGQLAAGIAHDFNNILQVIASSSELLSDGAPSEGDRELARTVLGQCERGARLIRQILDFGRRSVSHRRRLDLAPLLDEIVELLRRTLPETIAIEVASAGSSFPVLVDPGQLQQAITNLALNARDAMPAGGRLTFSLARRTVGQEEEPPVASMAPGRWIELTVTDTGTGIEEANLAKIFEPFFTTKPVGAGVGLGLSQVYGLVRQHDGQVRCTSRLGEGTTFTLFFPESREPEAAASRPAESGGADHAGTSVLLVEDDPRVSVSVRRSLEALGFAVQVATNGREALALLEEREEPMELVISDVVMPELGGTELVERLHQRWPSTRVLLTSGYPLGDELRAQRLDERVGWLSKPFSRAELSRAIENLMLTT